MVDLAEIQAAYYMVAATGVLIAAIYYVLNMRAMQRNSKAALETRKAQLLMQVYDKLTEPRVTEMWLDFVNAEFNGYPEFKKRFIEEPEKFRDIPEMAMIFEGYGLLVRERLIDIRLVALLFGGVIRKYFEKIKPVLGELRKDMSYIRFMDQTEYLYNQLLDYMDRHPELKT